MRQKIVYFLFSLCLLISGQAMGQDIVIDEIQGDVTIEGSQNPITFRSTVKGKITFKNVTTTQLTIESGAEVIIELSGGNEVNNLGKIINNGTLFFQGNTFLTSEDVAVINNYSLTDSTASLRVVEGAAHLIMGICEGSEVHNEAIAPVHGIVVTESPVDQVTFVWQRKNMLWWNDVDTLYVPTMGSRIINCYHEVERAGQYRFRAFVENEGVITSLISSTTTVGKTYDLILPETEGATLDPQAGTYTVEEGENFKFHLSLDKEYSRSEPFVTTSKRDTLEVDWDGYYTIKSITDSLTIFIEDIKLDNPSSNEGITTDHIIINSGQGQIEIYTPEATRLKILTFDGITRKNVRLTAGNHVITMPAGVYLLQTDRKTVKVAVK